MENADEKQSARKQADSGGCRQVHTYSCSADRDGGAQSSADPTRLYTQLWRRVCLALALKNTVAAPCDQRRTVGTEQHRQRIGGQRRSGLAAACETRAERVSSPFCFRCTSTRHRTSAGCTSARSAGSRSGKQTKAIRRDAVSVLTEGLDCIRSECECSVCCCESACCC